MYLKIVTARKWTFITPCSQDGSSKLFTFIQEVGQRYGKDMAGLLAKIDKAAQDQQGPRILNIDICHQINGNIYQISHGSVRMLFFYSAARKKFIVCATCFIKRGQKTPQKSISEAKRIEQLYTAAESTGQVTIMLDKEEEE